MSNSSNQLRNRTISLFAGERKKWRYSSSASWLRVEVAALRHLETEGWSGCAGEGGLVLSLIKAASFPVLPERLAGVYVEAIYHRNSIEYRNTSEYLRLPDDFRDPFNTETMVHNILDSDDERIRANFAVMTQPGSHTFAAFPFLTLDMMLSLYSALGKAQLHNIAAIFAQDPYTLRGGWPDLTLWKDGKALFAEVKAPGDELQANQRKVIDKIILRLGFDFELIRILPLALPEPATQNCLE